MTPEHNNQALDEYIAGWKVGDASRIHAVLDSQYTLSTGIPDAPPVPAFAFIDFFKDFRGSIAQ